MKGKKAELFEWVFIVLLFAPVIALARMRMHQKNLVLFVVLGLASVAAVMILYFIYRRRTARDGCAEPGEEEAAPNDDEA